MVQDIIFRISVFVSKLRGTTFEKNKFYLCHLVSNMPLPIFKACMHSSPECFDRLSSNFVVIDITRGSQPIDGKIDLKTWPAEAIM